MCDALYAAGHVKEAAESFLDVVTVFDEKDYSSSPLAKWVSGMFPPRYFSCEHLELLPPPDFAYQCLSVSKCEGAQENRDNKVPALFLMEWVKTTLPSRSWRDALLAAVRVSTSPYSTSEL